MKVLRMGGGGGGGQAKLQNVAVSNSFYFSKLYFRNYKRKGVKGNIF